jgi:ABC-type transport system involved in cytochrome c biogenesis permease subunit
MYELLCTAGFPMVYTRMLTLQELPAGSHYLYLALYNAVYVIPLMLIVVLFVVALGARKLQESEGRLLKLLSGMMMLALGLLLLAAPERLNNLATAGGVILAALAGTLLFVAIHRVLQKHN